MRLPRDLSGTDLSKKLEMVGYRVVRQVGSHMRLSTDKPTPHSITIPAHKSLRLGTLSSILDDVAAHIKMSKQNLATLLFS